jgi:hypothetical protein
MSGLVAGLSLQQSQALGTLAAGFSVTSQHTIHPEMCREKLKELALAADFELGSAVLNVLTERVAV